VNPRFTSRERSLALAAGKTLNHSLNERNRMTLVRTLSVAAFAVSLLAGPLRAAEADKYLPGDTAVVVSVNVKQALGSPLGKKHLVPVIQQQLKQSAQLTQALNALGFDPLKDFDSLTVATSGVASTDAQKEASKVTVIAHGSFDLDKLHAAADAQIKDNPKQLAVSTEAGTRVYENKTENQTGYFAFIDRTTLVAAGSKSNVVNAIKNGGKGAKLTKEMSAVLNKADGKQSVWFAAVAPEEVRKGLGNLPQTMEIADKIQSFSGGVTVDKDLRLIIAIHTADANAAGTVSQLLDTGRNAIRFAVTRDQNLIQQLGEETVKSLGALLEGIKIDASKDSAVADVKVTEDAILKLIKAAQSTNKP
jgi:hypothetical protein